MEVGVLEMIDVNQWWIYMPKALWIGSDGANASFPGRLKKPSSWKRDTDCAQLSWWTPHFHKWNTLIVWLWGFNMNHRRSRTLVMASLRLSMIFLLRWITANVTSSENKRNIHTRGVKASLKKGQIWLFENYKGQWLLQICLSTTTETYMTTFFLLWFFNKNQSLSVVKYTFSIITDWWNRSSPVPLVFLDTR